MSEYAHRQPDYEGSPNEAPRTEDDEIAERINAAEVAFGSGYFEAVSIIEAGLMKLEEFRRRGYVNENVIPTDRGDKISVPRFLATEVFRMRGRGELTSEGVKELLGRYLPRPMVVDPPQSPVYNSGQREYLDPQMAAAGDAKEK